MRAYALPLQILLALALVLNGIGGAVAGVLTALPASPEVPVSAAAEMQGATDHCGSHGNDSAPAPADTQLPEPGCHSGGDADCGDSAECRQACMHASIAVPPMLSMGTLRPAVSAILHPLASGHPAPPLPSPMRPPIA